jgi:hypothetical protein
MKTLLLSLTILGTLALIGCDVVMYPVSQAILAHDEAQNRRMETFNVVSVTRANTAVDNQQVFTMKHVKETVYLECTATFVMYPINGQKEYDDCPAVPSSGTVTLTQVGSGPWILRYRTTEGYDAYSALNLTVAPILCSPGTVADGAGRCVKSVDYAALAQKYGVTISPPESQSDLAAEYAKQQKAFAKGFCPMHPSTEEQRLCTEYLDAPKDVQDCVEHTVPFDGRYIPPAEQLSFCKNVIWDKGTAERGEVPGFMRKK